LLRPAVGRCWELRFRGDLQWHAGVDPFTVETLTCGKKAGFAGEKRGNHAAVTAEGPGIIYDQGLNLLCGIVGCCEQRSLP